MKRAGVIYDKEGLNVFTFYMVKKFDKILKRTSLSFKEGERRGGGILAHKFC